MKTCKVCRNQVELAGDDITWVHVRDRTNGYKNLNAFELDSNHLVETY